MLLCSAFELLSRPDTTASSFTHLAPELATIDPVILRRLEVEGMRITLPPAENLRVTPIQDDTARNCIAKRMIFASSCRTKQQCFPRISISRRSLD